LFSLDQSLHFTFDN